MDANINYRKIGYDIVGCAFEVRKKLGRFLLEEVYKQALAIELRKKGYKVEREKAVQIEYEGELLPHDAYRVDLCVNDCVYVEAKSLNKMNYTCAQQLLSYMVLKNIHLGYLINFGAKDFSWGNYDETLKTYKEGLFRFVNKLPADEAY